MRPARRVAATAVLLAAASRAASRDAISAAASASGSTPDATNSADLEHQPLAFEQLDRDDECSAEAAPTDGSPCALSALQHRALRVAAATALTSALHADAYDLRAMGPPRNAMAYKGMAWPTMTVRGQGEIHAFAIGDWGGLDGTLSPVEGRPRLIAYSGGSSPGPHVFPRDRWDKPHTTRICTHSELVQCYDTHGSSCPSACGYVDGIDNQAQLLVANAFKARAAKKNPAFILNVGDNFYWGGIEKTCGTPMGEISPTARHQFNQIFEGIYSGAGLTGKPWLSVLGNHDWGGRQFNNGWDQQIAYTWASDRWVMPAPYYSQHVVFADQGFTADIFMLDSNFVNALSPEEDPEHNICGATHNPPDADCSVAGGPPSLDECRDWFGVLWAEQKLWLEKQLAASKADWQIVVTHFPCGHEAGWYSQLQSKYGLDLLVTGHRHDQELTSVGALTCIVTGGGGGISSEASPGEDRSQWYGEAQYGFYDLSISKEQIKIESINYDGKLLKTAIVHPSR